MQVNTVDAELEILRSKFPAKFSCLTFKCPPSDSKPMELIAYRLCKNNAGHLDSCDFLASDVEGSIKQSKDKPSDYSVSFFEIPTPLDRIRKYSKHRDEHTVKGIILRKYGFVKRDMNLDKHVNLWTYSDAEPWLDFGKLEEIDISIETSKVENPL